MMPRHRHSPSSIRHLLQAQVNRAPYDAQLYTVVVNNYETLVQAYPAGDQHGSELHGAGSALSLPVQSAAG
jgi:hypothetical protein